MNKLASNRELADRLQKYERESPNTWEDGGLVFIRPASMNTACGKTLFRAQQRRGSESVSFSTYDPKSGIRSFNETELYANRKAIVFWPMLIKKYGLEFMFDNDVKEKFLSSVEDERVGAQTRVTTRKQQTKTEIKKEEVKMSKTKMVASKIKDINVDAAKITASIAAGKALNVTVQEKIVPKLPMLVRGYASTDLGRVVLANAVATALTYYAPENEKAQQVSQAMIQAAMIDLMASFDIEGLVKEFLNSDAAQRIVE